MAGQRWRAGRFVVDDDIVAEVTAARSMAAEAGLDLENFHWHTLGFVLLLHGDLVQATLELDGALAAARRAGDGSLELAGLAFLAWAHLRGGDVAGVKHVLDESAGLLSGTFPTSGMVRAMAVWVAWKRGASTRSSRSPRTPSAGGGGALSATPSAGSAFGRSSPRVWLADEMRTPWRRPGTS